jgi:hypothetical protein
VPGFAGRGAERHKWTDIDGNVQHGMARSEGGESAAIGKRRTDRQGSLAGDIQLQNSGFSPRITRHRSVGPVHDLRRPGQAA